MEQAQQAPQEPAPQNGEVTEQQPQQLEQESSTIDQQEASSTIHHQQQEASSTKVEAQESSCIKVEAQDTSFTKVEAQESAPTVAQQESLSSAPQIQQSQSQSQPQADAPLNATTTPVAQEEDVLDVIMSQMLVAKEEANAAFQDKNYKVASDNYEFALDVFAQAKFQYYKRNNVEQVKTCEREMKVMHCNIALCYMRLGFYADGIRHASHSLAIDSLDNGKAFYLRGKLRRLYGDYNGAKHDLTSAIFMAPDSAECKEEMKLVEEGIAAKNEQYNQLLQMYGRFSMNPNMGMSRPHHFFANQGDDDDDDDDGSNTAFHSFSQQIARQNKAREEERIAKEKAAAEEERIAKEKAAEEQSRIQQFMKELEENRLKKAQELEHNENKEEEEFNIDDYANDDDDDPDYGDEEEVLDEDDPDEEGDIDEEENLEEEEHK